MAHLGRWLIHNRLGNHANVNQAAEANPSRGADGAG
jgi:hypothetical protein